MIRLWQWLKAKAPHITYRRIKRMLRRVFLAVVLLVSVCAFVLLALLVESSIMGEDIKTSKDFVEQLRESGFIGALGNVTVISGLVSFLLSGARNSRKSSIYQAWMVLDGAQGAETSYARKQALTDLNDEGISLMGLDAEKADLQGICLNGANLSEATIPEINFQDASLRRTRFILAELNKAKFNSADLRKASFSLAKVSQAEFKNASLQGASFEQSTCRLSDFTLARLENSRFRGAELQSATFKLARLQFAKFNQTDLAGANFQGAKLNNADFRNAKNIPISTILKSEGWQYAYFDNAVQDNLRERQS